MTQEGSGSDAATACMGVIADPERQGQRITEWLKSVAELSKVCRFVYIVVPHCIRACFMCSNRARPRRRCSTARPCRQSAPWQSPGPLSWRPPLPPCTCPTPPRYACKPTTTTLCNVPQQLDLLDMCRVVCAVLGVPMQDDRPVEALHVLFSAYLDLRASPWRGKFTG